VGRKFAKGRYDNLLYPLPGQMGYCFQQQPVFHGVYILTQKMDIARVEIPAEKTRKAY